MVMQIWGMLKTEFFLDVWTWIAAGLAAAWVFTTKVDGMWYWLPFFSTGLFTVTMFLGKASAWLSFFSSTAQKTATYLSLFSAAVAFGYTFMFGYGAYLVCRWCSGPEGQGLIVTKTKEGAPDAAQDYKCTIKHIWQVILALLLIICYLFVTYYSIQHAFAVGFCESCFKKKKADSDDDDGDYASDGGGSDGTDTDDS